ncbi:MAG: transglutaminase domain-containing protein [Fimbriimonadaceae bacterium]|nr:transglutaminase domain-containing protein [Fimbriimonadaceae bacterium]
MPQRWWSQLGSRPELPTYVGGWLATLAWLHLVGNTIGDVRFNLLVELLTTFGFGVSFWLRGFQETAAAETLRRTVVLPGGILRGAFFVAVLLGVFNVPLVRGLIPDLARGSEEWLIGTTFQWAMALYSFGLLNDSLVAFSAVLGLSMLGLMGSDNPNPEVGLCFLAFLLGNVLMLSNMTLATHSSRRRRGPTGRALARWFGDQLIVAGLTVAFTAFGAILLAALLSRISPRWNVGSFEKLSKLGQQISRSGYASFSDQMQIGVGGGDLSQVMVFDTDCQEPLLWRRRVYDDFNGGVWTPAPGTTSVEVADAQNRVRLSGNVQRTNTLQGLRRRRLHVRCNSEADIAVPALALAVTGVRGTARPLQVALDRYGNPLLRTSPQAELVYEVALPEPSPDELAAAPAAVADDWRNYLTIPLMTRDVVLPLAERIGAGQTTPYARAAAIVDWLERECVYDATVRVPEGTEAVGWYLNQRRGACDLIATALALLARANGIPARIAVGYSGGEPSATGRRQIRLADAHAWAELYFEGFGWVPFNPAVPAPLAGAGGGPRHAAETTRARRRNYLLLGCLVLGAWLLQYVWRVWWRARPRFVAAPSGGIERAWYRAQRALARRRRGRRSSETLAEYLARLRDDDSAAAWWEPFEQLCQLFEAARYGWRTLGPDDVQQAVAWSTATIAAVRRERRPRR